MEFNVKNLRNLISCSEDDAWNHIVNDVLGICKLPLDIRSAIGDVFNRDKSIGEYDYFISSCAWELWERFHDVVPRNSKKTLEWWEKTYPAKAVLILDGLSLRELPWILNGADLHGFQVSNLKAYAAELPGNTNSFAKALGIINRSYLQNNGAKNNVLFSNSVTESVDFPWIDCIQHIGSEANCFFWHHWPDSSLHQESTKGRGLKLFALGIKEQFTGEDFWNFLKQLAKGRKLLITSDHGYADTGNFSDANKVETEFLKERLSAGRYVEGKFDPDWFSPPLTLQVSNEHGEYLLAIGRRKWKIGGGFPTLAHGGLSILEMLIPFVELTRK